MSGHHRVRADRWMRWAVGVPALALLAACTAAAPIPAPKPAESKAVAGPDVHDFVYLGEDRPLRIRLHVHVNGRTYEAAWQDFVRFAFAHYDTNGDGVLTADEIDKMPEPKLIFGVGAFGGNFRRPSLGDFENNAGGKVTPEAFAAYFRSHGGAPFNFKVDGGNQGFARRDQFGRPVQAPAPEEYDKALFALLDTNKDGKLSRDELAAAPAALLQRDEDDDEVLSEEELLPNMASGPVFQTAPTRAMQNERPGAFVMLNPGESAKVLGRKLLARYGPNKNAPGNKKLSRRQIGLDERSFKQLDADEDGFLDLEELARFNRLPPDFEIVARLGKLPQPQGVIDRAVKALGFAPKNGAAPLELVPGAAGRMPAGKVRTFDGAMMVDTGAASLQLNVTPGVLSERFPAFYRETVLGRFQDLDRDKNGYLDRNEAQGGAFFRTYFKLLDRDGNGKIFRNELVAYLNDIRPLQTRAVGSQVTLDVTENGRGLFDLLDTDRDGRLSIREMRGALKLLGRLDRDGDGQLARMEIPHLFQINLSLGAVIPALGEPVAFNAQRMAPGQSAPRERTAGPIWFRKMDRNRDGDVSRREFLGTDEEFAQIDADGDGLISLAEAEQADARFRGGRFRARTDHFQRNQ